MSKRRKIKPDERIRIAKACVKGTISLNAAAEQFRDWIKVYNGHKDFKKQTGGSRMTKGRETTQAERIAVAKACIANGKNYGEVAITYNVS